MNEDFSYARERSGPGGQPFNHLQGQMGGSGNFNFSPGGPPSGGGSRAGSRQGNISAGAGQSQQNQAPPGQVYQSYYNQPQVSRMSSGAEYNDFRARNELHYDNRYDEAVFGHAKKIAGAQPRIRISQDHTPAGKHSGVGPYKKSNIYGKEFDRQVQQGDQRGKMKVGAAPVLRRQASMEFDKYSQKPYGTEHNAYNEPVTRKNMRQNLPTGKNAPWDDDRDTYNHRQPPPVKPSPIPLNATGHLDMNYVEERKRGKKIAQQNRGDYTVFNPPPTKEVKKKNNVGQIHQDLWTDQYAPERYPGKKHVPSRASGSSIQLGSY